MKYTELIISVAITLLISSLLVFSFFTFEKYENELQIQSFDEIVILRTDREIRDVISGYKINYLSNTDKQADLLTKDILLKSFDKNTTVIKIIKIKDDRGLTRGLKVFWTFKGREYLTEETFSTISVLK